MRETLYSINALCLSAGASIPPPHCYLLKVLQLVTRPAFILSAAPILFTLILKWVSSVLCET